MNTVSNKNLNDLESSISAFIDDMRNSNSFDLHAFYDFSEDKFAQAGYRDFHSSYQHILIIHDGAIGDFVVESGAVREIRRLYPDAAMTLAVSDKVFNLAEFCPYVNEIIVIQRQHSDIFRHCLLASKPFRKKYFDICFAFSKWADTVLLMYLSGARIRITHDFTDTSKQIWYGANNHSMQTFLNLATHLAPLNVYGNHMADACFSLIDHTLLTPVFNRNLEVWFTSDDLSVAKSLLKDSHPLYALSCGGSHLRKHYPPEYYAKLLEMILDEEPNATFIIVGDQNDIPAAEIIKSTVPNIYENSVIDLSGKTTLRQTAAVLSLCDMYIGNDTCTMHVAAALNIPVLTSNCFPNDLPLTDNDVPVLWRPYNVPCVIVMPEHALSECTAAKSYDHHGCKIAHQPHCITQIAPEMLFKGFLLLKERASKNIWKPLYIS